MKKLIVILGLVLSCIPFFALEGTVSGQYVIYRDYTWKDEPTWIGFLYYDDGTYAARLYQQKADGQVTILFTVETQGQTLTLTGQKHLSGAKNIQATNYLMFLLPDLFKWKKMPESAFAIEKKDQYDTVQFGQHITVEYAAYIPLFHIKNIFSADNAPLLKLEEMGRISQDDTVAFFNFRPPVPSHELITETISTNLTPHLITVQGISFMLDSQWKQIAENALISPFALLTVDVLDASIVNNTHQLASLISFFLTSTNVAQALIPSAKIEGTPTDFTISANFYDTSSQKFRKIIRHCFKKGSQYIVISLTTSNQAFNQNKAYFEQLLRGQRD